MSRRRNLIFAIHLQTRGFAYALFDESRTPIDWGVYDARGADKNVLCLIRINSLLELHTPDVLVLQDMSERGSRRARRIRELNRRTAELADQRGRGCQNVFARTGHGVFRGTRCRDKTRDCRSDSKAHSCS